MRKPRLLSAAGLTLIELLVTLTIVGMMLLAAIPSMSTWMRNSQIRSVGESLMSGMAKARSEALKRNVPVRFSLVSNVTSDTCVLDNTKANWIVSLQDPTRLCSVDAGSANTPMPLEKWAQSEGGSNVTVSARTANVDGTCTATTSTATDVIYNGFGRMANSATALRCLVLDFSSGSGNRTLHLQIGSGGTLRLCDPAVTDTADPRKC